jgi:hypothetical protein
VAVGPPGDPLLPGIWAYTLPDNAVFVQSAPVISNIFVAPNFFDPSTPSFISPTNPLATVTFDLDKLANINLSVASLKTGMVLRRLTSVNVPAGFGRAVQWNGRADNGLFADSGDYRLALSATDSGGGISITRYALIRVFY